MELLIGLLGAVICITAFVMGFEFGKKLPEKLEPIKISEEERIRRAEETKAIADLFGYSSDVAYGGKN
jgi:hypothetical protein